MNNLKCRNPSPSELDGSNLIITERVNTLAQSGSESVLMKNCRNKFVCAPEVNVPKVSVKNYQKDVKCKLRDMFLFSYAVRISAQL